MAKVKGDVGQVKFDDGGSSVNPVLGTTSWSMSITKDIRGNDSTRRHFQTVCWWSY